jgi:transposase-like protein
MQVALEAEVTEFLGRDRYQRATLTEDARPGPRNGYREVTVKTTAGPVALARPKLRGTSEAFAPRRTHAPAPQRRTECVNNKTKMIKRQMFGRAGFELLRHRILLG